MKKILCLMILTLFLISCVPEEKTIKIGFIGPLTGPVANPGVYIKNSFELANKQFHSIDGKEIEVIFEDGKCIPKEGVTAAKKLLDVNNVDIIVSAICGGSTLAIAPLTEEKILISSVASAPAISDAGDHVFRISSSADLFAEKTANMIKKNSKIGIIVENTDYAVGWKDSFVKVYEEEVTGIEYFDSGDKDVKLQLSKIENTNPDAILFLVQSPISATLLVKQAKELGIETQLIGNEAFFSRQVLKNLMGDTAEGLIVITYEYDLDSSKMQTFLADYEAVYGEKIPEEMYGALGYDTYMVLYDALKKCEDSNCLKEYLYDIENREGVSGIFSIDEKGDGIRKFMWWQIKDGEIVPLRI